MRTTLPAVLLVFVWQSVCFSADKWADEFTDFSLERWTPQTSGLQLVNAPPPDGVAAKDGVLTILEPLRGARLTSRDRFLYGTLEARVRISPKGLQYVGFMSRSPWAANTAMCMTMPEGNGWEMILSRDRKGGHAGFGKRLEENKWAVLKVDWRPDRVTLDVDGKRIGEVTDQSKIPSTPIPLILDTYAKNRLELDYLRITDTTVVKAAGSKLPPAPRGSSARFVSNDWAVSIHNETGIATRLTQKFPARQRWTPEGSAAVDVYIRDFDSSKPVRFRESNKVQPFRAYEEARKSPSSMMLPVETVWQKEVVAELIYQIIDDDLVVTADFKALDSFDRPVEIGLGIPFSPEQWERIAMPRLPWLQLSPKQSGGVRLPFLADPNDATVTSDTGSWVHYPFGILQSDSSSVFWGSMDLGKRVVLAPGNHGCGPAVTLAPKTWVKGEMKRLSLRLRAFPRCTTEVLRWYLSHCVSSDPLTRDLFPVRDRRPRTLSGGGGVGMPDIRISRVSDKADPVYFDRVTDMLNRYHMRSLWFGSFHNIKGTYPTSGEWICPTGLKVSATGFKTEIARLKGLGLRPCLYTFQFIVPELNESDAVPSKDWVLHDILGDRSQFDSYKAGEKRFGAEWFTKELAAKVGSDVITWANVDFGRKEVRDFYFESLTQAIDYYEPSGICFDYGWGVLASNATYSPANPATSQPHARLRLQADIAKWMRKNHPDKLILINDNPGTPSQLFATCQLVENSDVMSDLDLAAGRALGSAMSSMDYFADHDESRWARHAMSNLSRGCSIGMPFWIPMNGPDDYVNSWQTFYDFSAKTTAVPIVPDGQAIVSNYARSISGTVWASMKTLLAAAFDQRKSGDERVTTLTIKLPQGHKANQSWRIIRLSTKVQPINKHGWQTMDGKYSQLVLSGPLRPGELVLMGPASP